MTGVPLDLLHCPTCGDKIVDFNLRSDPDEFDPTIVIGPITYKPATDWYLLCPSGHKWTVKTLWRIPGEPDRVQLDRFLGPWSP
jgi:hypothetical protein